MQGARYKDGCKLQVSSYELRWKIEDAGFKKQYRVSSEEKKKKEKKRKEIQEGKKGTGNFYITFNGGGNN